MVSIHFGVVVPIPSAPYAESNAVVPTAPNEPPLRYCSSVPEPAGELPAPPQAEPVEMIAPDDHVAHPSVLPVFVSDEPDGMTMLPAVSIVVVAVAPKYARYAEDSVDEALPNCCSAVHVFALPRFKPIVRAVLPSYVPENVSVEFVAVRFASATSAAPTVAQVAAIEPLRERTNWFVHEVPA